jgi:hypothetical protein
MISIVPHRLLQHVGERLFLFSAIRIKPFRDGCRRSHYRHPIPLTNPYTLTGTGNYLYALFVRSTEYPWMFTEYYSRDGQTVKRPERTGSRNRSLLNGLLFRLAQCSWPSASGHFALALFFDKLLLISLTQPQPPTASSILTTLRSDYYIPAPNFLLRSQTWNTGTPYRYRYKIQE